MLNHTLLSCCDDHAIDVEHGIDLVCIGWALQLCHESKSNSIDQVLFLSGPEKLLHLLRHLIRILEECVCLHLSHQSFDCLTAGSFPIMLFDLLELRIWECWQIVPIDGCIPLVHFLVIFEEFLPS